MTQALITGANGFVGLPLCVEMRRKGWQVRAAVRTHYQLPVGLDLVTIGTIDSDTDWSKAVYRTDVVVHLAARVHTMHSTGVNESLVFQRVNVAGTLNLARQAAAAGVMRFVFMSSVKVNGEETLSSPNLPFAHREKFREDDLPAPQDFYGISKMEAEVGLRKIAAQTGMEVVIIRPPLVYGPGAKANFANLKRAVLLGCPLPLGAVNNQRSLVAIDNLVHFIVTCCAHKQAANQTFLVSDGQDLSTTDLVLGMAQAARVPVRLIPLPVWALKAGATLLGKRYVVQRLCSNLQVDISKARRLLGWEPPVSVAEGLMLAMVI